MARIVIVDDNRSARVFASAALRHLGHELQAVEPACLFEILQLLHEAPPDLLITDLVMPTCPGQTLIRACREDPHLKQLKILLLSAHSDLQLAHFLQEMGLTQYLSKPVNPAVLAECVERFLRNGESTADKAEAALGTVAVVDDSQLMRSFMAVCLRDAGFHVLEIDPIGLAEVVEALQKARPRLLVLDQQMPHFNGDVLIRTLRTGADELLAQVPVLVVTSHFNPELEKKFQALKGVEVLLKPLQPDALKERVKALAGAG
jgi:two-component system chemotaxis response regulator CheY